MTPLILSLLLKKRSHILSQLRGRVSEDFHRMVVRETEPQAATVGNHGPTL